MANGATGLNIVNVHVHVVVVFRWLVENVIIQDPRMKEHFVSVNASGIKSANWIHAQKMSQASELSNARNIIMKLIVTRNMNGFRILIAVSRLNSFFVIFLE